MSFVFARPRPVWLAALVVSAFFSSAPGASAQGFFQSLFGGGMPQQRPMHEGRSNFGPQRGLFANLPGFGGGNPNDRAVGALDPADPALRRAIRRHTRAAKSNHDESGGSRGRQTALVPTPDAPKGSLALFMKDKTLRAGDVVVTNAGFRVYEGHGTPRPADFVAINAAGSGKTDRAALTRLEQVSRMRMPNVTVETVADAKPVAPPTPAKQEPAKQEPVKKDTVAKSTTTR
jgi:hypothetical protein